MSTPVQTKTLHCMQVHIFPSEEARLAAKGAGTIGSEDLVLTPDIGVTTYENMEAATAQAQSAAERAESIAESLEEAVAANAFQGPAGPQGEVGPQGPAGPGTVAAVVSVMLEAAGWSEGMQTIAAPGITAQSHVIVTPAPESLTGYATACIRAYALGEGSVSFLCDTLPGADMGVNLVILT